MEIFIHQKHIKLLTLILLFFLTCFNAKAQYSEEFETYKKHYPNSNSVYLNLETIVTIKLNKGNVDISQQYIEEKLYLDESATYNSKESINYSSFFDIEDIEASTYVFDDGKYREHEVKEFKVKDKIDQTFYDDTKTLSFFYPKLNKGSKTVLQYTEIVKNPRFLSKLYFGDFAPIVNNKVVMIVDNDINLKFQKFNTEAINISFNKDIKRNKTIYTWEAKNIDKFVYESSSRISKVLPHIIPIIESYTIDDKKIELANKVDDLYKWYYSLVKDINKDPSDKKLIELVEELTKDKSSDLEKVKAIYYWTQQNIKYIAFEYELGGFIPREANDIFNKKYGDCKDNSSLLIKMLEIAGIKGNLTWIGTRKIPYGYNEVPTPAVDNHMILSYQDNNNIYYLDATGRFIPVDFPTSFIQGKEALISYDENNFEIKRVPIVPAFKNAVRDTTTLYLKDGILKGTSKTEFSGYKKINIFNYLETESNQDKIKAYYNSLLRKGNNKFLIDNFTETNRFDYDKNFTLDYSFKLNDYVKIFGNEIFLNLNLIKKAPYFKTEDDRKNEAEFNHKSEYNYHTILNIPEGYTVDYLPENIALSNAYIACDITYEIKDNTVQYNHNITTNFLYLTVEQQKEVNTLIKAIEKAYNEVITLKKK